MLGAATYVPRRQPIGANQLRSPADIAWRLTWPFLLTTIIAFLMILCVLLIGALETASLSKSTSKAIYGNTSSTGAGFWCGIFFFIAAVFILLIDYMPRIRLWATVALIATIVAACFAVIIIGLDSKAIKDARSMFSPLPAKTNIIIAQLSFAIVELLLCFAFIAIYIAVQVLAPKRLRRAHRVYVR